MTTWDRPWQTGGLKPGSLYLHPERPDVLLMCVRLSGDGFWDFSEVIQEGGMWRLRMGAPRICGYCWGRVPKIEPLTEREYHLLSAGDAIQAHATETRPSPWARCKS